MNIAVGGLVIFELPVAWHLEIVALPTSRFLAAQIDACLNALAAAPSTVKPDTRPAGGA